jgi:hypothetical protein
VGFLPGATASFNVTLPGTVLFGFRRFETSGTTVTPTFSLTTTFVIRSVYLADLFDPNLATAQVQADANSFAVPLPYNAPWNQGPALNYTAYLGVASTAARIPNAGYDHLFLGFRFQDTTAGNAFRYGWIEVGLNIVNYNPFSNSGGPTVTIYGYAYDNTGAQLNMGQKGAVPEPSSAALIVIGALALGAPGLRKWRQNRSASNS